MGPEPHILQAKETQGQGGKVTHPRSHGSLVTDPGAEGSVGAAWLGLPQPPLKQALGQRLGTRQPPEYDRQAARNTGR